MTFSRKGRTALLGAGAVAVVAVGFAASHRATASDHAGTTETVRKPGTDFPTCTFFRHRPNNVVLAMSVRPLIPAGQGTQQVFVRHRRVYQFKIDNTGDNVEDLVIQARFEGTGAEQKVLIAGPSSQRGPARRRCAEASDTAEAQSTQRLRPRPA